MGRAITLTEIVNSGGKLPKVVDKIRMNGFAQSSKCLVTTLSKYPELRQFLSRFHSGVAGNGKGSVKYSSIDLFGKQELTIYYDISQKERLCEFLIMQFRRTNPSSTSALLGVFTKQLHNHNLHLTQEQQQRLKLNQLLPSVIEGNGKQGFEEAKS